MHLVTFIENVPDDCTQRETEREGEIATCKKGEKKLNETEKENVGEAAN